VYRASANEPKSATPATHITINVTNWEHPKASFHRHGGQGADGRGRASLVVQLWRLAQSVAGKPGSLGLPRRCVS
jgi:hypothetical protein